MNAFDLINLVIMLIFVLCCFYQVLYIPISWWKKPKEHQPEKLHRYAVLVAARNEEIVIGNLIESLRQQDYPSELVDIYVMADNCTDHTAEAARKAGAKVYERVNREEIGKGYVMHDLFEHLKEDGLFTQYDGFFIFDADNVLRENYISEMNRCFSDGYQLVTGYRNSKNFGDNWLTAGVGLWFLRESRYLNYPRYLIGSSSAIGGTGFCFAREVIEKYGGWQFFTLTEDLEFTSRLVSDGIRIGFCREAELYDEQPGQFRQSWRQRLRWSRGYLQMLHRYGLKLFRSMFRKDNPTRFAAFDILMNTVPAIAMAAIGVIVNSVNLIWLAATGATLFEILLPILKAVVSGYFTLFVMGFITMLSEWNHIHTTTGKKILYSLTFPLFMFTFMPISIQSMFCKVEWKPIRHTRALTKAAVEKAGR